MLISTSSFAQQNEVCVKDILALEEQIYGKKYAEGEKPLHLDYDIKTTDWEDHSVNSNVKIYRGHNNMHFFSNQAKVYQDDKDIVMVMKAQKMILRENSSEKIVNDGMGDEFVQVKKNFLTTCEVLKCENSATDKSLKIVELKAKNDMNGALYIDKMIYVYNPTTKKLIKSFISYKKGYKVKTIEINYNKLELMSTYKFNSAKKYVLDKKGKPLAKYSTFELVDNRENKK